jgi:hypothetical protein
MIVYFSIILIATVLIFCLIVLAIKCHHSLSQRLRDTGRAEGDPEASRPLKTIEC